MNMTPTLHQEQIAIMYRSAKIITDIPTLPHIKSGDRVNIEFFCLAEDLTEKNQKVGVYRAWRPHCERDAFFLLETVLADFSPLPAEDVAESSFH